MNDPDQNTQNQAPALWKLIILGSTATFCLMFPANSIPTIATHFALQPPEVEHIISWFLLGFGIGSLLFGPLANRYGRKKAMYLGFVLAITATLGSILAITLQAFHLFAITRLLAGIGTSSGIVVGTVMLKETSTNKQARYKFSYIVLFSSIAPSIAITLGGYITHLFGFQSLFWLMLLCFIIELLIIASLKETYQGLAISINGPAIMKQYYRSFIEMPFIYLVVLTTGAGAVMFLFNGLAPLIASTYMHTTTTFFSKLAMIPCIGFITGSLLNTHFTKQFSALTCTRYGLWLMLMSGIWMSSQLLLGTALIIPFMIPSFFLFLGAAIVLPNAAMASISSASDTAIGTAIFNAFNLIASATVLNLTSHFLKLGPIVLPMVCCMLVMMSIYLMKLWKKNADDIMPQLKPTNS